MASPCADLRSIPDPRGEEEGGPGVGGAVWVLAALLSLTSHQRHPAGLTRGKWGLGHLGKPIGSFRPPVPFFLLRFPHTGSSLHRDRHTHRHRSTHTCCHPAVAPPSSAHTGSGTNIPHSHSAHALPGRRHTVGLQGQNSRVKFQAGFVPKGKGREKRDRHKRHVFPEGSLAVLTSKGTYLRRLSWSLQGEEVSKSSRQNRNSLFRGLNGFSHVYLQMVSCHLLLLGLPH